MSQKMPFGHRGRMYSFLHTKICAFLNGKTPIAQLHSVWRESAFYKTTMLCVTRTSLLVCNTDLVHITYLHVYFAGLSYICVGLLAGYILILTHLHSKTCIVILTMKIIVKMIYLILL